jgi:CubicO group peptidase (beta-lactamase class C family)
MKPVRSLAVSIVFALPIFSASLQTAKPEDVGLSSERLQRIGNLVQRRMDAGDISGAVTLVARKGRVVHLEALGVLDLESKKPMPKDAVFRIASMSKPVTGVAILMLLEEGKLRLTDPVSKFIPELKGMKVAVAMPEQTVGPVPPFYAVPANREITIRDLLTHVSGLVSGPISSAEATKIARKPNEKLSDVIPRLAATPLEFQPGNRWSYSPLAGFDTLGRIVEIASGQTFDQFLRQRVFEPLGMTDTSFYPADAQTPRLVTSYNKTEKGLQKREDPNFLSGKTYFSGGGGLVSTAQDYAQFAMMLANGGEWNGHRFLSPRTVSLMGSAHVPDTLLGRNPGEGYGLSVRVIQDAVAGDIRLSNGSFGWSGAFGTHFWVDPKEKLVGIMMIQTPIREMRPEFENAVMQAIIE